MAARLKTSLLGSTSSETQATQPEVPRLMLNSPSAEMPLASVVAPASPVPV